MPRKKIILTISTLLLSAIVLILLLDYYISNTYKQHLYKEAKKLPQRSVGLVLGTSKILKDGRINLYYAYRIDAAVALWRAGKVKHFILSGDNSSKEYNEPLDMQNDLIAKGIPKENLTLDYAGFRTLDSVVRCKKVFGFDSIIIVSQRFHIERAVFIAQHKGIDALGLEAKGIQGVYGLKVQLREKLARVKLVLDLLLGVEPHFL